jgi:hypothetical protein|nr:MAG TPA: hypothetical protein [Caudoviricetes sp.]
MEGNKYKRFNKDKDNLSKAIEFAFKKKWALYLYPDFIFVTKISDEDCYLSRTTIIDSKCYDTLDSFNKEVNEIYDFKMSA